MALKTGALLGPYRIISTLGTGGMGEVYRARDTRLGREVALKIVSHVFAADEERRLRFTQEARVIAALNHPNIMSIYDTGESSGVHYIISELLEGWTLRDELRAGPPPTEKVINYAIQIARGLEAAHEKGIVHRDLKPENLFVTKEGIIKILDFGTAKQVESNGAAETIATQEQTLLGIVIGTVGYMSPEQVRGESVDRRADIFAFGVVLYEMLTGCRAFSRGSAVETMNAILHEEPDFSKQVGAAAHPVLIPVVRRCLGKKREERFQSARDVEFVLEDCAGMELQTLYRDQVPKLKHRWWWLAGPLALAGVAVSMVVWLADRAQPSKLAQYQRLTFRNGTIHAARFGPEEQSIVYIAAWDGPESRIYRTRVDGTDVRLIGPAFSSLLAISRSGDVVINSNSDRDTLARFSLNNGGAPRDLQDHIYMADWFPDGKNMAVVKIENGQSRLEAPAGKVVYRTNGFITNMRVSPQGDAVAFMDHPIWGDDRGSVAMVDLHGNKRDLTGEWPGEWGLAWSADGNEVWFSRVSAGYDWDRALYAVSRSGRQRLVLRLPGAIYLEDIAPNGRILFCLQERRYEVVSGETEGRSRLLSWLQMTRGAALSRDGRFAVLSDLGGTGGTDYSNYLVPTNGSAPTLIGSGEATALSPDSKWIASILPDDNSQIHLFPTGVGEPKTIGASNFYYSDAQFSSDGQRLIVIARNGDRAERDWKQDLLNPAQPQPITPEGVAGDVVTVNQVDYVAARNPAGEMVLFPLDGGKPQQIPGVRPDESVLGGSTLRDSVYAAETAETFSMKITKLNTRTGRREPFAALSPFNPAGLEGVWGVRFSADGRSYIYNEARSLSVLYTANGLR